MSSPAGIRTCIGCRGTDDRTALVRVVLDRSSEGTRPEAVPDPTRSRAGRGAWIHPEDACLRRALKAKAFARAFRGPVETGRLEEAWPDAVGPGPQPQ